MESIDALRQANPRLRFIDADEADFGDFGAPAEAEWTALLDTLRRIVPSPPDEVSYVASHPELEVAGMEASRRAFADLPVQIGYCVGRNSSLNGLEYHKCSEIIVAADDLILLLGKRKDIDLRTIPPTYDSARTVALFVPAGTAVELFSGTLHLAPCRARRGGFRAAIILARGTNEELAETPPGDPLLLKRNKWILAHPERQALIRQGAVPGLRGTNIAVEPLPEAG